MNTPTLSPQAVTLVMTATVQPPAGMPGTKERSGDRRLQEYLDALKFYLALPDRHVRQIAVLENSGADLSAFTRAARDSGSGKRLILLTTSADYPPERGKGYGEFRMLDEGIARLRQMGAIEADSRLWKVTGRLRVRNLERLVESSPREYALYCDLRSVPWIGDRLGGNDWMELRVFSFTADGYARFFAGKYGLGFVLEKVFFREIAALGDLERAGVVPRFRVQPRFAGVSGYSGRDYERLPARARSAVRAACRRWAPSLWI